MNEMLNRRLAECGIKISDILSMIKSSDSQQTIFMYSSHMEGLGTKDSDLDIYVLSDSFPNTSFSRDYGHYKVDIAVLNGIMLDIEYWNKPAIYQLIDDVNNTKSFNYNESDMEKLKLLHKLKIAETITDIEPGKNIRRLIEESKLSEHVFNLYVLYANSEFEDALNMYNSKEYLSALISARKSLENAMGAYNAKNGITNLKNKWISKILIERSDDKEIVNSYMKYQAYNSINENNIMEFVEELIEYIQAIMSKLSINLN